MPYSWWALICRISSFIPKDIPVVQLDRRGEQIGKRVAVDVPLVGTTKDTLRELVPLLEPTKSSKHLKTMREHYERRGPN